MRWQSKQFTKKLIEMYGPFEDVLDVGSYATEDDGMRSMFEKSNYVGVDMRAGPNVDVVLNAHDLKKHFKDKRFDLIICFDTLEHDSAFWITVENMKALLKPKGILAIGMPGRNCQRHDHPNDYWRFMESSVPLLLDGLKNIQYETQYDDQNHQYEDEVYGYGQN